MIAFRTCESVTIACGILLTLNFTAVEVKAENVMLRCSWDITETRIGGGPLDPSAVEAGKFFASDNPLPVELDLEKSGIKLSSTHSLVLGFGAVSVRPQEVEIIFENPKIKGLVGTTSRISIFIDRFSLTSRLYLEFWVSGKGYFLHSARKGACAKQVF